MGFPRKQRRALANHLDPRSTPPAPSLPGVPDEGRAPNVLIVTPVRKDATIDARLAAWLIAECRKPGREWFFNANEPVDAARNNAVEFARRHVRGWEYLLWVDADTVPIGQGAVEHLLEGRPDIVGGFYKLKCDGIERWSFKRDDQWCHVVNPQTDLAAEPGFPRLAVEKMGAGFMLVHRRVYERLPWPWYRYETHPMDDEGVIVKTGEDCFFCDKARAAGFEILVDLRCPGRHFNKTEL